MEFVPYASGSSGNLYTLSDGETSVILEAGLPPKKLNAALGHRTPSFAACLITHEHGDHSRGVAAIAEAAVPVYCSGGTAEKLGLSDFRRLRTGELARIGTLEVLPFASAHDAAEPLLFFIRSRLDGERVLFAIDTAAIRQKMQGLDIIAAEADYDGAQLSASDLPPGVVERIRQTHMSIGSLCDYLDRVDRSDLREIWLLHCSASHGDADIFAEAIGRRYPGVAVQVCRRYRSTP